jgi:hypothetical protein
MANVPGKFKKKIGCQQVLLQDASVFSIQWIVFPEFYAETLTPICLLEQYLRHIRRFTLSLIRPVRTKSELHFRLMGTSLNLISFASPTCQSERDIQSVTLSICGGFLVQSENCRRGELSFITKPIRNGLKVILQLSDYCPFLLGSSRPSRLRKIMYRMTQAYIHKIVTVRFLARLYQDLEGTSPVIRVVKARIRKGEDT